MPEKNSKIQPFNLTMRAAQYVVNLDYEQLPPYLIDAVKVSLRDYIAVALAGSQQPIAQKLRGFVGNISGPSELNASVFGGGCYPLDKAALLNGAMAHALDFDDCQTELHGHPSVAIWPAILAAAELSRASGRDVITAYIAATEVMCKLCGAIEASHYGKGWHATGSGGVIGAVVGAAKIMCLNTDQICNAIGIAASMASGLRGNFGSMTKPLHAGWAAQNGITAVLMTLSGVEAKPNILEKQSGYIQCFSNESVEQVSEAFDHLGETYSILMPGLKYKAFPCCNGAHPPICAALALRKKDPRVSKIEDIADVVFYVQPWQNTTLIYPRPKTGLEGKFSGEYCVARALIDGSVSLDDFTDKAVHNVQIVSMIEKCTMIATKTIEEYNNLPTLIVTLKDGTVLTEKSIESLGHRLNPMSEAQHQEKFFSCAVPVIGETRAQRGMNTLKTVEDLKDISSLVQQLYG